jgi:hypothetical protein
VPVTLRAPDFRPDLDALRAAITPCTRMILLNTPHNPTGVVFSAEELAQIAALACAHDLLVVSDEVYEHMVYDGTHLPIASLPGMFEPTVTISSAMPTACGSAANCRSVPEWPLCRTRCSMTTKRPAGRRCVSPSARSTTFSPRRCGG